MDGMSEKDRLIVVSNRLPFVLKRDEETQQLERKSRFGTDLLISTVTECQ